MPEKLGEVEVQWVGHGPFRVNVKVLCVIPQGLWCRLEKGIRPQMLMCHTSVQVRGPVLIVESNISFSQSITGYADYIMNMSCIPMLEILESDIYCNLENIICCNEKNFDYVFV